MPNEFIARNGLIALNNTTITGSFTVGAFTSSFAGPVGIGTTTPSATLDVNGYQVFSSGGIYATSAGTTALTSELNYFVHRRLISSGVMGFKIFAGSDSSFWRYDAGTGDVEFGNIQPYPLKFYTNNTEKLRILSNGNVGIGTTSPSYLLDVSGSARVQSTFTVGNNTWDSVFYNLWSPFIARINDGNLSIFSSGGTSTAGASYELNFYARYSNPGQGFQTGKSGYINGNVTGIGNDNGSGRGTLTIGTVYNNYGGSNSLDAIPTIYLTNTALSGSTANSGRVGINISSPAYTLDVSGSTRFNGNSQITGSLNVTGSITITGSLNVTAGITGSLLGTASWAQNAVTSSYILNAVSASFATSASLAQTASYVLNAVSASFASTASSVTTLNQNVIISGSLTVFTGSAIEFQVTNTGTKIGNAITDTHTVTGSLNITGSENVQGSGSAVFSVDGTSGRLFQVDDSLSGSLFSVNTAGGLPVVEAFSDNTVRIGQYGQKALFVSQSRVGIGKETALNAVLDVSGSVVVTGSLNISSGITGSLFGTASWATNALTSSNISPAITNNTNNYVLTATGTGQINGESNLYFDGTNLGIGTTSPSNLLEVNGISAVVNSFGAFTALQASGSTGYRWTLANDASFRLQYTTNGFAGLAGTPLYVSSSGNIGIGTTTPGYPLVVSGNVSDISIYASNDIVAYSDRSVKTNLEIIPNAIDKIKQINGYTFERTDNDNKRRRAGVIAQEVEKILPEVIAYNADGTLGVAYGNMVALLIECIKEQQIQIDELKSKINGITK